MECVSALKKGKPLNKKESLDILDYARAQLEAMTPEECQERNRILGIDLDTELAINQTALSTQTESSQ